MTRTRQLALEELAPNLVEAPTEPGVLDLHSLFGNDNPLEIEVGCGKGHFLLQCALAFPEINFLGIELDRKYQLFSATRMAKRKLTNVRLASADARTFLGDFLPPACCQRVHVYFPDPWWKQRHRKRRLFTPEFLAACAKVLIPGGLLLIATDVEEYFSEIINLVATESSFFAIETPNAVDSNGEVFITNFERKAILKGTAINRAAYERR